MKKIIFVLFTSFFCHISGSVNAKAIDPEISFQLFENEYLQDIFQVHKPDEIVKAIPQREVDPNRSIVYYHQAITETKLGNYRQAIIAYTQAIESIDSSNLHADESTIVVNNARKAGIYSDRGLVKLKLGDKRGAIDDLTLAAELFDEVGLSDVSARSMRIVKSIDN
jgi:tetratricopeptide (TPR) repeat protein